MLNIEVRGEWSVAGGFKILFLLLLVTVHCMLLLTGCASTKGPKVITPVSASLPEYSISGQRIVFNNKYVKIGILPLSPSETKSMLTGRDANNPLVEILSTSRCLTFLVDMENTSKAKIMYDPVLTTLFDSKMGLHKHLDYTDLYSLAGDFQDPESMLNNLKGMFYDLAITLEPGERVSRLLIFSGMEEGADELTLTMREVYIGASAIEVSFGFKAIERTN